MEQEKTKRPLGLAASILALVFAFLYAVQAVLTIVAGCETLQAYHENQATMSNVVGEFLFTVTALAAFVLLLLYSLRALKKVQSPSSPFAELSLLYFWIGIFVILGSIITLTCFGMGWKTIVILFAGIVLSALGFLCYQRGDGTILENQILFFIASGFGFLVGILNLTSAFNSGWYSLYDASHALVPMAFYVLSTLSVIFEEKEKSE
jgi:hypothetical protein